MKFKELTIGQVFSFDRAGSALALRGFPKGPWVKISVRCYRKSTSPYANDWCFTYQVGTINVKVLSEGATK